MEAERILIVVLVLFFLIGISMAIWNDIAKHKNQPEPIKSEIYLPQTGQLFICDEVRFSQGNAVCYQNGNKATIGGTFIVRPLDPNPE